MIILLLIMTALYQGQETKWECKLIETCFSQAPCLLFIGDQTIDDSAERLDLDQVFLSQQGYCQYDEFVYMLDAKAIVRRPNSTMFTKSVRGEYEWLRSADEVTYEDGLKWLLSK